MLDATGCRHWASITADSSKMDISTPFFCVFSSSTCRKWSRVGAKAPVFNRGMTYQSDRKDLNKVTEYFVGGGLN